MHSTRLNNFLLFVIAVLLAFIAARQTPLALLPEASAQSAPSPSTAHGCYSQFDEQGCSQYPPLRVDKTGRLIVSSQK